MKIKISVTEGDIKKGRPLLSEYCPVYFAISRAWGDIDEVLEDCFWVCGEGYSLPESARNFIFAFDHGQLVKPFEFEVDAP